jgi:hypothetical protein
LNPGKDKSGDCSLLGSISLMVTKSSGMIWKYFESNASLFVNTTNAYSLINLPTLVATAFTEF